MSDEPWSPPADWYDLADSGLWLDKYTAPMGRVLVPREDADEWFPPSDEPTTEIAIVNCYVDTVLNAWEYDPRDWMPA
jgi:hypothetical protein